MNLILLDDNDFTSEGQVTLRDRRHAHIRTVHRAAVGDKLRVGRVDGKMGQGTVLSLTESETQLEVTCTEEPPPPLSLTLLLALPRPKFLTRVLQTATSLGVKDIYLFNSYRVEKVYWSCEQLSDDSVREACLLGLEQARDTILPRVHQRRLFKPFAEDELPTIIQNTMALVAHPVAEIACPYQARTPVTLAIGPEGGFIDYEVQKLRDVGFQPVRLAERILKVETAVATLIGRLT